MGNYITDCWSYENKRRRHIKVKSSKDEIFEDMEEVKEEVYVGIGIKRMRGYKCDLKVDELNKLRNYFWEIKTNTNNKNWLVWDTIRRALSYDELRASILLQEYEIKTADGCINHLIDSKGNHYKIPNYCINDPYFEKIEIYEKKVEEKMIKIKLYGWKEFIMEISNKKLGKDLKNEIKIKEKIEDNKIIRLFYRGMEIKDNDFLYNHGLNEFSKVNLIVN